MKVLVLDNYDSFTYNLVHIVRDLKVDFEVFRNDKISLDAVANYDKILLSPGPGLPDEAGILKELIARYAPTKSILGVCLGHQAIAEVFGGKLLNLDAVYHGVATDVKVLNSEGVFANVPTPFSAGRYHSWVVDTVDFPDALEVTAVDERGVIMGLRHRQYDVQGVQFHPESVLTPEGAKLIENFLTPATILA